MADWWWEFRFWVEIIMLAGFLVFLFGAGVYLAWYWIREKNDLR